MIPGFEFHPEHRHPDVQTWLTEDQEIAVDISGELAAMSQQVFLSADQARALAFDLGQLIELAEMIT